MTMLSEKIFSHLFTTVLLLQRAASSSRGGSFKPMFTLSVDEVRPWPPDSYGQSVSDLIKPFNKSPLLRREVLRSVETLSNWTRSDSTLQYGKWASHVATCARFESCQNITERTSADLKGIWSHIFFFAPENIHNICLKREISKIEFFRCEPIEDVGETCKQLPRQEISESSLEREVFRFDSRNKMNRMRLSESMYGLFDARFNSEAGCISDDSCCDYELTDEYARSGGSGATVALMLFMVAAALHLYELQAWDVLVSYWKSWYRFTTNSSQHQLFIANTEDHMLAALDERNDSYLPPRNWMSLHS